MSDKADGRPSLGRELPPVAPSLMESLRAVGYSASAALADLIDNSISAKAHRITITFAGMPQPVVIVLDDGEGMDRESLIAAMRYGSRDPREVRAATDLGRFGLGLKTASLSQCRRMTVVSFKEGQFAVAVWDLDDCGRRQSWWLGTPDTSSIPDDILRTLSTQGLGTAVIWEGLDRMLEGTSSPAKALDQVMEDAANHLAMVFHRFLDGSYAGEFSITVNGRALPKLDPFLEGHVRGQALHAETFKVEGHTITVSPFVLPFPSRLQPQDLERAGGRESLKTGHGFYIYRGGRLVVPGGGFASFHPTTLSASPGFAWTCRWNSIIFGKWIFAKLLPNRRSHFVPIFDASSEQPRCVVAGSILIRVRRSSLTTEFRCGADTISGAERLPGR
jgi:hypothetical protein